MTALRIFAAVRIAACAVPLLVTPSVTAQTSRPTAAVTPPPAALRFALTFPTAQSAKPIDGRVLLFITSDSSREPRSQSSDFDDTAQMFGIDVESLAAGQSAIIDGSVLGYPLETLGELPPGDYWVQGLLHRYETYHRADGKVVKLPADRGEGQQWETAPGNFYSTPKKVHIDPKSAATITLSLDKQNPALPPLADTKYVKRIQIRSDRLSKFWGRDIFLGALVVLPEGWDAHPTQRYPLAIYHGHFQREVAGWRETPPDPKLPKSNADSITRYCPNGHEGAWCTKFGYDRVQQEYGWNFFKEWTGPDFPRVIMVTIQHANQYYDDSYAVNSQSIGPYGDAITYELIPFIEQKFRGIGAGWARAVYGGSTGGWEALAVQMFYPDQYNGAYANCPDPIDFRSYTVVDLYADSNAYYTSGPFRRTPRPGQRDYLGRTRVTMAQINQRELVLGTKSRSGQQWDIWEAVYSPVGADGYPKRIWDKRTGVIDKSVATYWRDHYDLGHILERDWRSLGPKLRGKIEINVGLSDNYFLNDAVYRVEDFLMRAKNPPADAVVQYGQRDEHCWSGDASAANAFTRLTYNARFIRKMAERWTKTAPKGGDVSGWRY